MESFIASTGSGFGLHILSREIWLRMSGFGGIIRAKFFLGNIGE